MSYIIQFIVLVSLLHNSWGLMEAEWKEAIAKVYNKLTKEVNEKKVGADFRQLFSDDAEEMWPGVHFKKDNVQASGSCCYTSKATSGCSVKKATSQSTYTLGSKGPISAEYGLRNRHPMAHQDITLRELLYSSSDLAVVRSTNDVHLPDGSQTNANGLELFVRERNGVKIKFSVFTFV